MVGHCVDAAAIPLEAQVGTGGGGMHVDESLDVKSPKEGAVADVLPPGPTTVLQVCVRQQDGRRIYHLGDMAPPHVRPRLGPLGIVGGAPPAHGAYPKA